MGSEERFINRIKEICNTDEGCDTYYILFLDLTDFMAINHYYGITAGDQVLDALNNHLSRIPEMCICEHLVWDIFAGVIRTKPDRLPEDVRDMADREVESFLKEQQKLYPACDLKAAVGIERLDFGDIQGSIDRANLARKECKCRGSLMAVVFSQEISDRMMLRYEKEREVNTALHEGRFCFYLQPKVELRTGEIIGAEALARRVDPNGEIVYPDHFLDIMEANGSIVELDMLICRQTCEYMAKRMEKGLPVVPTSVNLSRLHIQNLDTADRLHAIAESFHIPPDLLEFELTETILMEEFSQAKFLTDRLRSFGYKVSIDDFGSGYAGISIWQELDFDMVKLDKKFLDAGEERKERNEALVPNILDIGQRLKVDILCEGVETEQQCRYLLQMGCTIVQGYYFSKPVPAGQFYETYEALGGRYPLTFQKQETAEEPKRHHLEHKVKDKMKRIRPHKYWYVAAVCLLTVMLCVSTVMIFSYYQKTTKQQFSGMVLDNVNAYADGQRAETVSELDGIMATIEATAVMIEKNEDDGFVDVYLESMNEENPDINFYYISMEAYKKSVEEGTLREEDREIMEKLSGGEQVISPVIYSKRMGDVYCIACAVPVFKDGEFLGAVRGIIDARNLISTSRYPETDAKVLWSLLTDDEGNVIPVSKETENWKGNLYDYLRKRKIREDTISEIKERLYGNERGAESIYLGEFEDMPIYLTETDLGYNGWHLVVCSQAEKIAVYSRKIVRNTMLGTVFQTGMVLLASLAVFLIFILLQRRIKKEEERYLMIEQFSDVALFDYDCRRDTIRFTPNVGKMIHIHGMVQTDFVKDLNGAFVFPGDINALLALVRGELPEEHQVRIRLMRPSEEEFFWCGVDFQYIREKGTLLRVIGRIQDIEEQIQQEEHLLTISRTDRLTGLLNKSYVEEKIREKIERGEKGILFVIDIDDFKQINDIHGHAVGDAALRYMGECIRQTFRTEDMKGRIGGDEMIVYLYGLDNRQIAQKKVRQLMSQFSYACEYGLPSLSASVGIAICPEDADNYRELFEAADDAMYMAKHAGKHQYQFYREDPV